MWPSPAVTSTFASPCASAERIGLLRRVCEPFGDPAARPRREARPPVYIPLAGQLATARDSRCAPTLRFTRCRALSTVFVSHASRSPICS